MWIKLLYALAILLSDSVNSVILRDGDDDVGVGKFFPPTHMDTTQPDSSHMCTRYRIVAENYRHTVSRYVNALDLLVGGNRSFGSINISVNTVLSAEDIGILEDFITIPMQDLNGRKLAFLLSDMSQLTKRFLPSTNTNHLWRRVNQKSHEFIQSLYPMLKIIIPFVIGVAFVIAYFCNVSRLELLLSFLTLIWVWGWIGALRLKELEAQFKICNIFNQKKSAFKFLRDHFFSKNITVRECTTILSEIENESIFSVSPGLILGESIGTLFFSPLKSLGAYLNLLIKPLFDELSYVSLCLILPIMFLSFLLILVACNGGNIAILNYVKISFGNNTRDPTLEQLLVEVGRLSNLVDQMVTPTAVIVPLPTQFPALDVDEHGPV